MKNTTFFWLFLCLLFTGMSNPVKAQLNLQFEEVDALVKANAPLVYFHSDERYLPSSVDWFLARADLYKRSTYPSDGVKVGSATTKLSEALVPSDQVFDIGSSEDDRISRKYYLKLRNEADRKGNAENAKLYVNVHEVDGNIGITYWIFYPYNGEGTMRAGLFTAYTSQEIVLTNNGVHAGDWERITSVLDKTSKQLKHVYFEAHGDAVKVAASDLVKESGQTVAFSSYNGHGFYHKAGDNTTQVKPRLFGNDYELSLLNKCNKGKKLNGRSEGNYQIIDIDASISQAPLGEPRPAWVDYPYLWGEDVIFTSDKVLAKNVVNAFTHTTYTGEVIEGMETLTDNLLSNIYNTFTPALSLVGGSEHWQTIDEVRKYNILDNVTQFANSTLYGDGLVSNGPPGPATKPAWKGEQNIHPEEVFYGPIAFDYMKDALDWTYSAAHNAATKKYDVSISGKAKTDVFAGNFNISGAWSTNSIPNLKCKLTIKPSLIDYVQNGWNSQKIDGFGSIKAPVTIKSITYDGPLASLKNNQQVQLTVVFRFNQKDYSIQTPVITLSASGIQSASGQIVNSIKQQLESQFGQAIKQVIDIAINVAQDVQNVTISTASNFKKSFFSVVSDFNDFITSNDPTGWLNSLWGGSSNSTTFYRAPKTVPVFSLVNRNTKTVISVSATLISSPQSRDFFALLPYRDKQTNKQYFLIYNVFQKYYLSFNTATNSFERPSQPTTAALWDYHYEPTAFFKLQHKKTGKFLAASGTSLILNDGGSPSHWRGAYTDYVTPKDVLAGKGEIIASLYEHSDGRGLRAYLRNKDYSAAEFANIFPPEELSSVSFHTSQKTLTLWNKAANSQARIGQSTTGKANFKDFGFNDKTCSVQVVDGVLFDPNKGFYKIMAGHSNLVITPHNHGTANGTRLLQWNKENNDSQYFQFEYAHGSAAGGYYIKNKKSGKYLEVVDGQAQNGYNNIQLNTKDFTGANKQKFYLLPVDADKYYIKSMLTGDYVLTIEAGKSNKGANLGIWGKSSQPEQPHQKFTFVRQ